MSNQSFSSRGQSAAGTNPVQIQVGSDPTLVDQLIVAAGQKYSATDVTFAMEGAGRLEVQQNNDVTNTPGAWFTRKTLVLSGAGNVGDMNDTPWEVSGDAGPEVGIRLLLTEANGGIEYGADVSGDIGAA